MEGVDYISLTTDLQQLINADQAWHYQIVPKAANNGTIAFYASNETQHTSLVDELEILFGKKIELEHADKEVVRKALTKYYRRNQLSKKEAGKVELSGEKDFLASLIREAKQLESSDIHIEIYEDNARVRLRIDGHLIEKYIIEQAEYPALINKIKIRANLDIAEKRLPQDGRIYFDDGRDNFDLRVSILPTLRGEKAVLRLLSKDATNIDIAALGFSEKEIEDYLSCIRKPHGIVLISGPTGSGKTTTLYATLKILNEEKRNILTVEDPIEYTLEGINQVQLKESIGLNFASTLRTFLRQDPDVIMVGEIRDAETAQIAIRAALTGHLVLSTVHTNSAWGIISRLIDMGIPPYLLSNTMNGAVAQRLVRKLCPECKEEHPLDPLALPRNYNSTKVPPNHFKAVGCENCYYTGYRGRTAVYEVVEIDNELADNIKNSTFTITPLLEEKKVKSLADNAFALFVQGSTSLEEIYPILLNHS